MKTKLHTNLVGRKVEPIISMDGSANWWTVRDKSETGFALRCQRGEIVACRVEDGSLRLTVLALGDGPVKGHMRDLWIHDVKVVEE